MRLSQPHSSPKEFFTIVRFMEDPARSWSKQKSSEEEIFTLVRFLEDPAGSWSEQKSSVFVSSQNAMVVFLSERENFRLAFNNALKVLANMA